MIPIYRQTFGRILDEGRAVVADAIKSDLEGINKRIGELESKPSQS